MKKSEIDKVFPPGKDTETDNVALALIKIYETFLGLLQRDREIGVRFSEFMRFKLDDEPRARALLKLCIEISAQFKTAAETMLDAAITLDMALLDREAARRLSRPN